MFWWVFIYFYLKNVLIWYKNKSYINVSYFKPFVNMFIGKELLCKLMFHLFLQSYFTTSFQF